MLFLIKATEMRKAFYILAILMFPLSIMAQHHGGTIYRLGNGEYCAAVKTDYFIDYVATQQEENWCWAACIEMVLHYQGVNIAQDDIVRRVFGYAADRGGTIYDIIKGADGLVTNNGTVINAKGESPSGKSKISFIDDLAKRYPLIVGLSMPGQTVGHAFVMTGIVFTTDASGHQVYPRKVILRNPWPYSKGQTVADREELTWSDFISRVHTIVHIYPSY